MKKTVIFSLVSIAFMGCSQKSPYLGQPYTVINERTIKMPPKMVEEKEIPSDSDSEAPVDADASAEDSCDPNGKKDQCTLIPLNPEGCLGCANGEGHRPVNTETAKRIMMPLKDTCMPKMKEFKGPKKGAPTDESCRYNAAECSKEGKCVGITLSKEELQKRMPKMPGGPQGRPGMMDRER